MRKLGIIFCFIIIACKSEDGISKMIDIKLKIEDKEKEIYRPSQPIKFTRKGNQNQKTDCKYYQSNHQDNEPLKTSVCASYHQVG